MIRSIDWWLADSHHVVVDEVSASPDEVRDFYCAPQNIVLVHPLVISVRVIDLVESDDSRTETYRVRDRIPFGPVTLAVAYTAHIVVPRRGDVRTEALQFPRVRLRGRVSFDAVEGGTLVTERLHVTAPRPLAAVTVRTALEAHTKMLAEIRRHFG